MQFLIGSGYGDYNTSNWHLHTGTGDRHFDIPVIFQTPFLAPPAVQVNLSEIDADQGTNLRVGGRAVNVTSLGFTLSIHAWGDTKLYATKASWFAFIP
jgi:hypothetical protein